MMRTRRGASSARPVAAWLLVVAGLVVYGALAAALGLVEISRGLRLPWWAVLAAPAVVDALAVRLIVGRVSMLRWLAAALCLWGVQFLLGALTAVALPFTRFLPAGYDTLDGLVSGALLGILWVPLLPLPLRDVIRGSSSTPKPRSVAGRHVESLHRAGAPARSSSDSSGKQTAVPTTTTARPGATPPARTRGVAPASDRPVAERPVLHAPEGDARPSAGPRGSADSNPTPKKPADEEGPPGDAAGSSRPDPVEEATPDATSVLVRVSFDRVAAQFPPGTFHGALEAIGERLPEPGQLTIPRRLVLAQLSEGFVRVGWEVVAAQFPRDLLAMSDEEVTRQLADGQLVLPLDELIPQLPSELFRPKGRAVDVDSIASIPPPFQPAPTDAKAAERAPESPPDGTPPSTRPAEATTDCADDSQASAGGPLAEVAVLEHVALGPAMVGPVDDRLDSLSIGDGRHQPAARGLVENSAGWSRPCGHGSIAVCPSPEAAADTPVHDGEAPGPLDTVAAALAPISPLTLTVQSAGGVRLLAASAPGRSRAAGVARTLLPFLDVGRAPWPVNQLTMWGEATVLVLTPLPSVGQERAVLVAAVPPAGGVAAIERSSLRAPGVETGGPGGSPRIVSVRIERGGPPDLVESEPSAQLHQLAASLSALGPVAATLLRDVAAERDLYLFMPEGSDVRMTGRFAVELDGAVRTLAGVGYPFHTAVLRCGRRRLIVRLQPAARSVAPIVVAGGPTDRAGLAFHQVEAAALLLAAG